MQETTQQAVDRYLRSGEHDSDFQPWPGSNYVARARAGDLALREALISVVRQRTVNAELPEVPADPDLIAFARGKVAPMVRGLLPATERDVVLDVLCRSVVFLTPASISAVLEQMPWLSTAWNLANLYLDSIGAELLGDNAPVLVGFNVGATCYLSAQYFEKSGRFDDFLVHEAAHTFHNCKRRTIGLRETRRREWLLEIDFAKRETFAYACEAYSRICELGQGRNAREILLAEYAQGPMPADDRVDRDQYLDILREAVAARNGWKQILARCSPSVHVHAAPKWRSV